MSATNSHTTVEPLDYSRLVDGEPCYRCGKVISARLSHICDPKLLARRADAPPGRHTAASLADVLEKDYALSLGAQIFLSGHEWGLVVAALRSETRPTERVTIYNPHLAPRMVTIVVNGESVELEPGSEIVVPLKEKPSAQPCVAATPGELPRLLECLRGPHHFTFEDRDKVASILERCFERDGK